jgi:hypothetical protein
MLFASAHWLAAFYQKKKPQRGRWGFANQKDAGAEGGGLSPDKAE